MGKADLCEILGDVEVNDFSAVTFKHDKCIQDPKCRGCDNERVDRQGVSQVVAQKAAPKSGGRFGAPRQIPPDCGLTDRVGEVGPDIDQLEPRQGTRKDFTRHRARRVVSRELRP